MVIIFPVVMMTTKMDVAADDDIDNCEDESNDAGENECDTAAIDYNAADGWSMVTLTGRRGSCFGGAQPPHPHLWSFCHYSNANCPW